MGRKAKAAGIVIAGLLIIVAVILASRLIHSTDFEDSGLSPFHAGASEGFGNGGEGNIPAYAGACVVTGEELTDVRSENPRKSSEAQFKPFEVADDGAVLPDNQRYTGIVCNIQDSESEVIELRTTDGNLKEQKVSTFHLNNVWFSVPEGGSRCFGVPIFSTEYYAEGEWEQENEWHDVQGIDYPEFNEGMEKARALIREGYLQSDLEDFLLRYPEINPKEREYTLYLTGGGRTDRREDDTSWWELDYMLATTAENGELVAVAHLDISRVTKAQGYEGMDDARCRIWSAESGYWRLLEDPSTDLGKIWISQLPEEDFSGEEKVRSYVEGKGADFNLLLPGEADRKIKWKCRREETGWYDYLVWMGTTDTYEVTLAIPLMEEGTGGWYMASRIRKEAAHKEICRDTLLTMMQTFHEEYYGYTVKEGETLWDIYQRYGEKEKYDFAVFAQYNHIKNPGLIYPGFRVKFPYL